MPRRDNFSATVRDQLALRVGHYCSLCTVSTIGPQLGRADKAVSTGEAAHICAASPGGPRYDQHQSPEDRSSIANGIWVCSNCSDRIDKDDLAYSVERLLALKKRAEGAAAERQGKPFCGVPSAPQTLREIARSIQHFCLSEEMRLERLDPRFRVNVGWSNGSASYQFRAAGQNVHASIEFFGSTLPSVLQSFHEVWRYGGKLHLSDVNARFTGSPIFDEFGPELRRILVETPERDTTIVIEIGESDDDLETFELAGKLTSGTDGIRIAGTAFSRMVSVEIKGDYHGGEANLTLCINLRPWEGVAVSNLPHFARLSSVIRALDRDNAMRVYFNLDGQQQSFLNGRIPRQDLSRYSAAIVRRLRYYRLLDRLFDARIPAPSPIDNVLGKFPEQTVKALRFLMVGDDDASTAITVNVFPEASVADILATFSKDVLPDFRYREAMSFELDGALYGPFDAYFTCPEVCPKILRRTPRKKDGTIRINLRPSAGQRWTISSAQKPAFLNIDF